MKNFLIVGLGNPGNEYAKTRHNAGFLVIDLLMEFFENEKMKKKFNSYFFIQKINDKNIIFLKPLTFMNNSGEAVKKVVDFYKIPVENILLIYDEINLDFGTFSLKNKRISTTHNGVKNIIFHLMKNNIFSLRIGIKNNFFLNFNLSDFVLSEFSCQEIELIKSKKEKL